MTQESRLTLTGLAKLAGVSTSTASRALRDNPLIKKETRENIQALAKEHNFSINHAASQLRTQKTNVVAVILNLTDHTEQSINDPFLLKMVSALNLALNKAGYEMLLSNSMMASCDWASYFISSRRADGLIIVGQGKSEDNVNDVVAAKAPLVVWGDPKLNKKYPIVGSDNQYGGYLATKQLIESGCKKVLFLGDPEHAEMAQRYVGYQQAILEAGLEFDANLTINIDITSKAAYEKVNQEILNRGLFFDGIFAVSDMVAFGALKALKERYVSIPGDVSVVGFDDINMAELFHPALTTVRQDTDLAAQLMVEQLISQFEQKPAQSKVLDVELIKRRSTP
ncbi:LacI family DNA-binding transcriptional regulator [Pseudoalteromonas phenolica]|uniref:LacI family DNA-binding transcriptional regulator n=1 Tax=Pseudoalteromonas phenolica TaxID=161398 RepID=UPI0038507651